jgi:hypothetical protein
VDFAVFERLKQCRGASYLNQAARGGSLREAQVKITKATQTAKKNRAKSR